MNNLYKFIIAFSFLNGSLVVASQAASFRAQMNQQHQQRVAQNMQNITFNAHMAHARNNNVTVAIPADATQEQRIQALNHNGQINNRPRPQRRKNK